MTNDPPDLPDLRLIRDRGLHPADGPGTPPPGPVRCHLTGKQVAGQLAFAAVFAVVSVGLCVVMCWAAPVVFHLPAAAGPVLGVAYLILFAWVIRRATAGDHQWVEVDGDTIRGRHLYTRRRFARPVGEVAAVVTVAVAPRGQWQPVSAAVANHFVNRFLGRVRGVDVRFTDGRGRLRVQWADPAMVNAAPFVAALFAAMRAAGEVSTDVVDVDGRPMVRRVTWADPA